MKQNKIHNSLIVLRHGESLWNQENRFTGWEDIDLSETGKAEAKQAGRTLAAAFKGQIFDQAYTSVLKRAIRTLHLAMDEMNQLWLPVQKSWRLNERHYGALTGLNKTETAARHGEEQVLLWRRSFDVLPPPMEKSDPRHPSHDSRYRGVEAKLLPQAESLKTTIERVLPLWNQDILPQIQEGKKILIAAHGNSLRALVQILEKLTPDEIMAVNIPTGIPLQYDLEITEGGDISFLNKKYLGDQEQVQAAIDKVKNQGKK